MHSIMWKYIDEETAVLGRLLKDTSLLETLAALKMDVKAIYFVSHGSSYNAAIAAAGFISRMAGVRAYAYTPANLLYNCGAVLCEARETTLVVPISQTGTSRGAIEAMQWARNQGFRLLSVTDVEGSPVHTMSDATIFLGCGAEDSNAKTKGYSATLLQLLRLGLCLGLQNGRITQPLYGEITSELSAQVAALESVKNNAYAWSEGLGLGKEIRNIYVLGYGMNYGTAMEGQLKLMETMCMPTMFNDLEEFSHGMHRAIDKQSTVLLLSTPHKLSDLAHDTYRYLKGRAGQVLMVDASGQATTDSNIFMLPWFEHTQSLLLTTLVIQVISVWMPEYNGKDPNAQSNNDYTEVVQTRI